MENETIGATVYVGVYVYQIRDISDVRQQFQADFRLFLTWEGELASPNELGLKTPEFYFDNIIEPPFIIDEPTTKSLGNNRYCYQTRYLVTCSSPMQLNRFPFDSQQLDIVLRIPRTDRQGIKKVLIDSNGKGVRIVGHRQLPDWLLKDFRCEATYLAPESINLKPEIKLRVTLSRHAGFWIYNAVLPLSLSFLILWGVYLIPREFMAERFAHCIGVLSLLLFLKFIISDRLPQISYLTVLDKWLIVCYILWAVATGSTAVVSVVSDETGDIVEMATAITTFTIFAICTVILLLMGAHVKLFQKKAEIETVEADPHSFHAVTKTNSNV
eukprot:m.68016 g.68016  ORF g.68016 m.68016 type:complete len:328 (-) comp11931_c0_seq2:19-1002(-)